MRNQKIQLEQSSADPKRLLDTKKSATFLLQYVIITNLLLYYTRSDVHFLSEKKNFVNALKKTYLSSKTVSVVLFFRGRLNKVFLSLSTASAWLICWMRNKLTNFELN